MNTVPSENTTDENNHLAEEHGLTKTTAYVRSNTAKRRSTGAKRVAKHRQLKKERGIVQVDLPISVAEEIRAAGSFDAWMNQYMRIPVKRRIEICQELDTAAKVKKLHPWLRWILNL